MTLCVGLAYIVAVLSFGFTFDAGELAVYALSFWHYVTYALAFLLRQIDIRHFSNDAIALKTVAVGAIALPYLSMPVDLISITAIIIGIVLNVSASISLGLERTYYGFEIAGLPAKRVSRFPYSIIAHPMLIGNMIAFGGALLNSSFRQDWWPLAVLHVVGNGLTLIIEIFGRPCPIRQTAIGYALVVALLNVGFLVAFWSDAWIAIPIFFLNAVFAAMLFYRYSSSTLKIEIST